MKQDLIFLPMGALAIWTFVVLLIIPFRRFAAARRGFVKAADFKFGESTAVPGEVSIPNRNYMNLLEVPLLFYVAGLVYFASGKVDIVVLVLSWLYVALRLVHSVIHLGYNNVFHRLIAFASSNVILVSLWLLFFVRYFAG
jgi:hypothetical protein